MNDELKRRRKDDIEVRSKSELKAEIAHNKTLSEDHATMLLHELQVRQIELEAQNQELRQTQQHLEEARDRYADLYDFAPVGYLTLQENGRVLEINLTGASMLGRERQAIVGQNLSSCLSPKEEAIFLHHLYQTFSAQCNVVSEIKIKFKGAKSRFIRLESALVSEKNICRTVMIDITQQKLATEALQRTRAAEEVLLQSIPAVVFYQDMSLEFIAASQVFADFAGCSIKDLIGKTPSDVLPRVVAEDFQCSSQQVLDSGEVFVVPEYAMNDLAGNKIYIALVRAPYRDAKGKVIGLIGAGVDITAIKNASILNANLLEENRALTRNFFEAQEKERRHLARELHDELGQWLTAIQAEAQAICNISDKESKIHDSAEAISKSARAVHGVVRNMLRQLRPSMLDELGLADSLRELQRQWSHCHPDIVCEFNLDVPLAGMSESTNITVYRLIQEALNNVASHAHASKVKVMLQRETGNAPGAEVLLLNIQDDGVGYDTQQAVFGMGVLGMRERVISAGGGFVMYSDTGRGTHLQASLPLKTEESS